MQKPTKALAAFIDALNACHTTTNEAEERAWRSDFKRAATALYDEGERHLDCVLGRWALSELADHFAPWQACGEKQDDEYVAVWILYGVFTADKDGIALARERIDHRVNELLECAPDTQDRHDVLVALAFLMSRYVGCEFELMKKALEALAVDDYADCSPEVLSFIQTASAPDTALTFKPLRA